MKLSALVKKLVDGSSSLSETAASKNKKIYDLYSDFPSDPAIKRRNEMSDSIAWDSSLGAIVYARDEMVFPCYLRLRGDRPVNPGSGEQ